MVVISQVWMGDPISVLNREYHHPRPGYNPVSRKGYLIPHQQDRGTPLISRMGYLVAGWGYPPHQQDVVPPVAGLGYPPHRQDGVPPVAG